MDNFDERFDMRLMKESWTFYSVGMAIIVLRLYARTRKLHIANLQADDYLMILVALLYTGLVVTLNIIAGGGGSNLYPPGLEATFTPDDIRARIFGSKIVVLSEQFMLNVIYTLKACMLLMYTRLTAGLRDARGQVRWLTVYVAGGYFATQLAFFTACRPFEGYWALPPPDPQCTTLERYALVQGAFNISADVLMLGIPIPLVVRMRLPWRRKIVLVGIFSLGLFVVVAALLTKVFNLTDVYSPRYMLWYVREASVAVYVSNLPMIWPLMREWFPALRQLSPGILHGKRYTGSDRKKNGMTGKSSTGLTAKEMAGGSRGPVSNVMASKRDTLLPPYDDLEMAMMGKFDREKTLSGDDDWQSRPWSSGDSNGSGVDERGPQIPQRVLWRPTTVSEQDPNYVVMQMENQAKQDVSKGIQVHTVVEVRGTRIFQQQERPKSAVGCEVKISGGNLTS